MSIDGLNVSGRFLRGSVDRNYVDDINWDAAGRAHLGKNSIRESYVGATQFHEMHLLVLVG